MTDQDPDPLHLLQRRLDLVAAVSALTARTRKLIQQSSGIEMEVLRLELAIGRDGENGHLVRELHDTEERAAALWSAQAECSEEMEAMEAEIAAVDRLIAAANGGKT